MDCLCVAFGHDVASFAGHPFQWDAGWVYGSAVEHEMELLVARQECHELQKVNPKTLHLVKAVSLLPLLARAPPLHEQ
eukprot:1160999-Pelagomonas_calceolata.AAC.3